MVSFALVALAPSRSAASIRMRAVGDGVRLGRGLLAADGLVDSGDRGGRADRAGR
jgi:hypothetical protein